MEYSNFWTLKLHYGANTHDEKDDLVLDKAVIVADQFGLQMVS